MDNPASVPPRYEPRRGAGGGWYYETESGDDDILQELIQLISEQILPGMDEESLTEDLLIEEVEQELSERAEQYKGEIRKAVDSIMTEKLSMDRVYVNSEDEVPEGYQAMRDDVGDLYYEVRDAPHIDSGRTSKSRIYVDSPEDVSEKYESQEDDGKEDKNKSLNKEYELEEGLTWTERVMVTDIDEESGMVTMVDTEGPSEWQDDMDDVEAKLEQLETREHDWMYELIAGEYASLEENEVHDVLHDAAGLEKQDEDPCWEGYVQVGMKEGEDGEMVPNCVPEGDVDD